MPFLRELDKRGILYAARDTGAAKCEFFCVRKEWDSGRGLWLLRLVLDRRPRDSLERLVRPADAALPHGACFLDLVLDDGEQVRLRITDLPSFYYSILVTDARARTNQVTDPLPEAEFQELRAVEALIEREREAGVKPGGDDDNDVVFCLSTVAMGDKNATTFGQCAHVQLLRDAGLMKDQQTISYRKPWPRSKVAQGVVIDDQAIVAITPTRQPRRGRSG